MSKKFLNDYLELKDLSNVKIRFIVADSRPGGTFDPVKAYEKNKLYDDLYHVNKKKPFKEGDIAIGLFRMNKKRKNEWLLFHIGKITKDLNIKNGLAYEADTLDKYKKYFNVLVIEYHKTNAYSSRKAEGFIDELKVIRESGFLGKEI